MDHSPTPVGPPVDFLIITALPEERDAVLRLLDAPRKLQLDGAPTYYIASVPANTEDDRYGVAVTMLNAMGNVEAAHHTTRALTDLAPDYVLMVGIAGGVQGEVQLGDVIIAQHVWYYELAKVNPDGTQPRPQEYPVDRLLLDRMHNYMDHSWHHLIQTKRPSRRRNKLATKELPELVFGAIATGEKVVADTAFMQQIRQSHPKIIGVEMEAFGVAVAAASNYARPRFIAIRGVCDFADHTKNDAWHQYAAESAAAFAIGFLQSGPVPPRAARVTHAPQPTTMIAIRHQSMERIPENAVQPALVEAFGGCDIVELVVDQANLYHNRRLTDPFQAIQRQRDLEDRLNNLLSLHPNAHVAYYSIAHIPLLFLAGSAVSNRREVLLFDFNRETREWNQLHLGGVVEPLVLTGLPTRRRKIRGDVVLCISISYSITTEDVQEVVPDPIASIALSLTPPRIDKMTTVQHVRAYGERFRYVMDQIHEKLPYATTIHIFYAGPPAYAFYCGQHVSKSIHPPIIVYNYLAQDTPKYSWGIDITGSLDSPDVVVRPGERGRTQDDV